MTILVGTSGWTYDSWAGPFYPEGVARRRWLEYYAERLPTVELNASHYRWPRDTALAGWHDRLPAGFEMAVKAPRALTHAKRLYAPERWSEIIARGCVCSATAPAPSSSSCPRPWSGTTQAMRWVRGRWGAGTGRGENLG